MEAILTEAENEANEAYQTFTRLNRNHVRATKTQVEDAWDIYVKAQARVDELRAGIPAL